MTKIPVHRVSTPAKSLYQALNGIGISSSVIRSVLPSWWDDSYAEDPLGLTELKVLLARRLSIDPATIFSDSLAVEFLPVVRRYKGGRQDLISDFQSSTAVANALCRAALSCVTHSGIYESLKDPVNLREKILSAGAGCVGLEQLLDLCWGLSIPVLHVSFPQGLKKFDALVVADGERYAIALCRNEASPSWLAFHLAHEIGHIACGHLAADGVILDEKIEDTLTVQQELEANDYASKLLGSDCIEPPKLNYKKRLAQTREMVELGRHHKVLPGHLVLKAGSRDNNFPCARAMLTNIEATQDGRKIISLRAFDELHRAGITEEAEEFLEKFSSAGRA